MHWVTSSLLPDTLTDLSLEPGTEQWDIRSEWAGTALGSCKGGDIRFSLGGKKVTWRWKLGGALRDLMARAGAKGRPYDHEGVLGELGLECRGIKPWEWKQFKGNLERRRSGAWPL